MIHSMTVIKKLHYGTENTVRKNCSLALTAASNYKLLQLTGPWKAPDRQPRKDRYSLWKHQNLCSRWWFTEVAGVKTVDKFITQEVGGYKQPWANYTLVLLQGVFSQQSTTFEDYVSLISTKIFSSSSVPSTVYYYVFFIISSIFPHLQDSSELPTRAFMQEDSLSNHKCNIHQIRPSRLSSCLWHRLCSFLR